MNERNTRLFRGQDGLTIYAGDFFLCVERNWYYWFVEKWIQFNWQHMMVKTTNGLYYSPNDLRPSSPLEFLIMTGRPLESQLV